MGIFSITGCLVCSNAGSTGVFKEQGVQISMEWASFQIQGSNNENRDIILSSLRNKIKRHFYSKAHALAEKIENLKKKMMCWEKNVEAMNMSVIKETKFRNAYYLAKNNRPFTDHEALVELQHEWTQNGTNSALPFQCY